jgi:hypothetical protein
LVVFGVWGKIRLQILLHASVVSLELLSRLSVRLFEIRLGAILGGIAKGFDMPLVVIVELCNFAASIDRGRSRF